MQLDIFPLWCHQIATRKRGERESLSITSFPSLASLICGPEPTSPALATHKQSRVGFSLLAAERKCVFGAKRIVQLISALVELPRQFHRI